MNWIIEILEINPFTITCLWNDNEIRTIDLTGFIKEKSQNPKNSYYQLSDKERFAEVKCDGTTIYWEDGIRMKDFDGIMKPGPLDIDPEILYELSYHTTENTTSYKH